MKLPLTLTALLLAPFAAQATVYQHIVPEQSSIRFNYQQMGVEMDGGFDSFKGELYFDTDAPEQSKVELLLALQSVDTGLAEADEELEKSEWFNSQAHPQAVFRADKVSATGPNSYQVQGQLEIKGQQQAVSFNAELKTEGQQALLIGQLPIKRGDFKIGEGPWANFDVVANEVTIDFSIAIAPAN